MSTEMVEKPAKIRKGSPKREARCYQTLQDIVIPVGTILRDGADAKNRAQANIGCGAVIACFDVPVCPEAVASGYFKQVIA